MGFVCEHSRGMGEDLFFPEEFSWKGKERDEAAKSGGTRDPDSFLLMRKGTPCLCADGNGSVEEWGG